MRRRTGIWRFMNDVRNSGWLGGGRRLWAAAGVLLWLGAWPAAGKKWEKLEGCKLAPSSYMDGDSFHVQHGKDTHIFRLYFVDAPETDTTYKDRLVEQAKYFGVPVSRITRLGHRAQRMTQQALKPGFTVYTKWADARGQSSQPRFYALVRAGKQDLGELLVQEGLARVYGASEDLPEGRNANSAFDQLRSLETRAKQKRKGVWGSLGDVAEEVAVEEKPADQPATVSPEEPGAEEFAAVPVVEEEVDYVEVARRWPNVPTVGFLRAEAFINLERYEEAEPALEDLLAHYPDHEQKPRIRFYLALSIAMQERFKQAIFLFEKWLDEYEENGLRPEVEYWLAIALYYDGQFEDAQPLLKAYALAHPETPYAPEAAFRAALCRYVLEEYLECALDLGAWLEQNPEHVFYWEALVVRGDALAACGELEQAKTNYLRVTKEAGPFYYLALTQLAKVYKALGTEQSYRDMAAAFGQFVRENPDSGQLVEAAWQAGWALRQAGRPDEARRLYWGIVDRHGNNRDWEGFQDIWKDLAALYPDPAAYRQELTAKYNEALTSRRLTLASRLALAEIARGPAPNAPATARDYAARFKGDYLGAEALAFLGGTLASAGDWETARPYLQTLLERHPESFFAPLAHVRLAEWGLLQKDDAYALDHANRVLEQGAAPTLVMEATMARARSLAGLGRLSDALEDYQTVLANRATPRALKPEALLESAAVLEGLGRVKEAIPYYQRVYVMYQAYPQAMARAYLKSAEAFEKLDDRTAAVNTYQEMLGLEALAEFPEVVLARQRLGEGRP